MAAATLFTRHYLHGTRADLRVGDLIVTGYPSNFRAGKPLSWVYFTATMDAAIWGAELAAGDAPPRIYLVEPTGEFVDDPNVTNQKFPGNPTRSYRTRHPLKVIAEAVGWTAHPPHVVDDRKQALAAMRAKGADLIID